MLLKVLVNILEIISLRNIYSTFYLKIFLKVCFHLWLVEFGIILKKCERKSLHQIWFICVFFILLSSAFLATKKTDFCYLYCHFCFCLLDMVLFIFRRIIQNLLEFYFGLQFWLKPLCSWCVCAFIIGFGMRLNILQITEILHHIHFIQCIDLRHHTTRGYINMVNKMILLLTVPNFITFSKGQVSLVKLLVLHFKYQIQITLRIILSQLAD